MQAQTIARDGARARHRTCIAHGCTAAGNDQVRFEVALRTLAPELEVIRAGARPGVQAPGRAGVTCRQRKLPMPPYGAAYSINRGLWGVTIGGKETLTSQGQHSGQRLGAVEGRVRQAGAPRAPHDPLRAGPPGRPRRQDADAGRGDRAPGDDRAAAFGIGRGIHLGDTIIGTKGRVAFEAPAAEIAAERAPRAGEAGADAAPAAHQGAGGRPLRRPGARGPAARSGVPRHRGAAAVLAGARHRRRARAAASRLGCSSRASSRRTR